MKTGTYKIVKGDATSPEITDPHQVAVIAHVCNNIGGWGAGFVLAISKKWSEPEAQYRRMCREHLELIKAGFSVPLLGTLQVVPVEDQIAVANMVAQHGTGGGKPLKYTALTQVMQKLAHRIRFEYEENTHVSIHCPKFGAGLAGGKWELIEELIKEIWCDAGIDVTVYEFE